MNEHMPLDAQQRERLSALMDGQAEDAPAWDDMDDAQMRECWHLYHVVGDVLRSPELAHCADDAAFLARLRERIHQDEPPHRRDVAPEMAYIPNASREPANDSVFRWKVLAAAASLAAVALVAWNVAAPPATPGAQMAQGAPQQQTTAPVLAAVSPAASSEGAAFALEDSAHGVMLRDPYLDELLAAHQQAAGASGITATGFLRNATFAGGGR